MFERCFKTLKTLFSSRHKYMNVQKQGCVVFPTTQPLVFSWLNPVSFLQDGNDWHLWPWIWNAALMRGTIMFKDYKQLQKCLWISKKDITQFSTSFMLGTQFTRENLKDVPLYTGCHWPSSGFDVLTNAFSRSIGLPGATAVCIIAFLPSCLSARPSQEISGD